MNESTYRNYNLLQCEMCDGKQTGGEISHVSATFCTCSRSGCLVRNPAVKLEFPLSFALYDISTTTIAAASNEMEIIQTRMYSRIFSLSRLGYWCQNIFPFIPGLLLFCLILTIEILTNCTTLRVRKRNKKAKQEVSSELHFLYRAFFSQAYLKKTF